MGLKGTGENGSIWVAMYGDIPNINGKGFAVAYHGTIINQYYYFTINGNSATGYALLKRVSTGEYSSRYPMTGVKLSGPTPTPTPDPTPQPTPDPSPIPAIDSSNFDPSFYLNNYPDLAAAGYTTANVKDHWDNNGIHEGRQGSVVFDVKFYLQTYPDLQLAYGTNYYAAHTHWQYSGIYEGRQGSASFDAKAYLQRYPDLQHAFGNDYKAAALHYLNSGKQEGRNGAP